MQSLPAGAREQAVKAEADAYFAENPDALSYVRAYHPGEVHPLLALVHGEEQPEAVAVAVVCPGTYARVMIHPGMLHATGRIWAEQAAREERVKLGMKGRP